MRYVIIALGFALLLGLFDYYVFYNWRRFARYRRLPLRLATRIYHVLVYLMPVTLPAYIYFSRWWEVEPKLFRAFILGVWALYYVPKLPIALVLLLKDAARLLTWQFHWFRRLSRNEGALAEPTEARSDPPDLNRISRAEFIRRVGWSAASIPFVITGYSVFRSLYDYRVTHVTVPIASMPATLDGLTIAQISDLHAGSFFSVKPIEEAVEIVNSLRPDLILFTGDFVNNDAAELEIAAPALGRLRADLGAFACLGNHDHYAEVGEVVQRVGNTPFKLLINQHARLDVNGSSIFLVGTDNSGFNQNYADLPAATAGMPPPVEGADLRLLMTHDPSYWETVRIRRPDMDLTLSGHTHGGQLGFELGSLRWSLARITYPRWAGLYREPREGGNPPHFLYVNRGLGTVGPPLRIGIRPEVTLLTLRRA